MDTIFGCVIKNLLERPFKGGATTGVIRPPARRDERRRPPTDRKQASRRTPFGADRYASVRQR